MEGKYFNFRTKVQPYALANSELSKFMDYMPQLCCIIYIISNIWYAVNKNSDVWTPSRLTAQLIKREVQILLFEGMHTTTLWFEITERTRLLIQCENTKNLNGKILHFLPQINQRIIKPSMTFEPNTNDENWQWNICIEDHCKWHASEGEKHKWF